MHTQPSQYRDVYTAQMPVVLASASPRRHDFLHDLGIAFSVCTVPGAEPAPLAGEVPDAFARRAAHAKTVAAAAEHPRACTIGADTIVVLHTEIMGKPHNTAHALAMLTRLAGATHQVITGVCVALPDSRTISFTVSTHVTMAPHSQDALRAYIRTGEPMDKAGAYAIQGIGAFLVTRIDGSWSNVVGLPVVELLEVLMREQVVAVMPG